MDIKYLSNAGVFIESNNKKIMIDVLCGNENLPFKKPTPAIEEAIYSGKKPFDSIDVMLHTHAHEDHFDSNSVKKYLRAQKEASAFLVLTTAAKNSLEQLKSECFFLDKVLSLNLHRGQKKELWICDIKITVLSLIHEGVAYKSVENFAFLIELDGKKILHLGDAAPTAENFDRLSLISEKIDLLLAPFLYITLDSAFSLVEKLIQPKKMVITHLPYEQEDAFYWRKSAVSRLKKVNQTMMKVELIENVGDQIEI